MSSAGNKMGLYLKRLRFLDHGIYSRLSSDDMTLYTLEHAYETNGIYLPKVRQGTYTCIRGVHHLEDLKPFITFEVMNVPYHTGILFHVGNYNKDSDGCLLLGLEIDLYEKMVIGSRVAFEQFMKALNGIDDIQLTIED